MVLFDLELVDKRVIPSLELWKLACIPTQSTAIN